MSTLGRVQPPPDARDAAFPMALHLTVTPTPAIPKRRMWRSQLARINQGNLGACVGFTGANWIGTLPIYGRVTDQTGFDLYAACKLIDGYPGEGTWDRILAKVLVAQGRIERYLWATSPAELKAWVLTTGPVMVGTEWTDEMFDPDTENGTDRTILRPVGAVVGGHEWLVRGYDPKIGYRMRNSWGPNWADRGEAWIGEADLNTLVFNRGGDALGAVEKRP